MHHSIINNNNQVQFSCHMSHGFKDSLLALTSAAMTLAISTNIVALQLSIRFHIPLYCFLGM